MGKEVAKRLPPKDCNSCAFSGNGEGKAKQKTATPEAVITVWDLGKKGEKAVKEGWWVTVAFVAMMGGDGAARDNGKGGRVK
ncbi:hypothetical protein GYH30_033456 [Glycine max]|nr:hypothetical protein GYH30_033456 [Glycine max]